MSTLTKDDSAMAIYTSVGVLAVLCVSALVIALLLHYRSLRNTNDDQYQQNSTAATHNPTDDQLVNISPEIAGGNLDVVSCGTPLNTQQDNQATVGDSSSWSWEATDEPVSHCHAQNISLQCESESDKESRNPQCISAECKNID
jgi:hypothetical protein